MVFILGSQSKGRKAVLESAGYEFEVAPADIDEKSIRDNDPYTLTEKIARAKADALKEKFPAHVIVTGDTVAWCDSTIYEKPESKEEFYSNYRLFQEKPVDLISSVVVTNAKTDTQRAATDTATVKYRHIPVDVLDAVVAKNIFHSFAGGVAIEEELLLPYITVTGEYGTAMGLPLEKFKELLTQVS